MRRIWPRHAAHTIRQLPRNEQPALATHLHSGKALIEARNQAAKSLRKRHRLWIAELWLAVFAHLRLTIFVFHRGTMVVRRIEFGSCVFEVPAVEDLVKLVGLGVCTGANLNVLVTKRECRLHHAMYAWHAGWQLHSGGG